MQENEKDHEDMGWLFQDFVTQQIGKEAGHYDFDFTVPYVDAEVSFQDAKSIILEEQNHSYDARERSSVAI